MADDPRPASGPDDGPPADQGGKAAPDRAAPGLVWPPTDAELDAWEVVPLRHDSPGLTPPAPPGASSAAEPAPVSSAAAVRVPNGAVVVHTVSGAPTRLGKGPGVPSAAEPRAELNARTKWVRQRLAAPRSAVVLLVIVALLAILSAAAGFAAALWLGGAKFPSGTPGEPPPSPVLIVESREPGSQVLVNGEPRGTTPLRLSMADGETRIEVEPRPAATRERVAPTAGRVRGSRGRETAGSVLIRSKPPGARVVFGGRVRGVTPLAVGGITPGVHDVEIAGTSASVTRRITVTAGQVFTLDVDLRTAAPATGPRTETRAPVAAPTRGPTGHLRVRSQIPLQILTDGRPLGTSTAAEIPVEAGDYDLRFVAEGFEFSTYRRVQVRPGGTVTLAIDVPTGRADFDAEPRADVWVRGRRLGKTPLRNVELPLGIHQVVFRHPQLGERRETVTVRARTPARVSVRLAP